jgi:hypothetical protein
VIELELSLADEPRVVAVDAVVVAGWVGRDRAAVEEHIAELEALGVPRPSSVPVFYRVSPSRLTAATEIQSTAASTGEAEPVLLAHAGEIWVGVGSDHTDREVETYGVAVSKQLCDKPIARSFWRYDDVVAHWDEMVLRSWIDEGTLYQEGKLATLLGPAELLSLARPPLRDGTLMFGGTLPAIGGIRRASSFAYELEDPVLGRSIGGGYAMRELPLVS